MGTKTQATPASGGPYSHAVVGGGCRGTLNGCPGHNHLNIQMPVHLMNLDSQESSPILLMNL